LPLEAILLIIGGILGFALGYGVRAGISSHRRARTMHRKMGSLASSSEREPQFAMLTPAEQNSVKTSQDNRALPLYADRLRLL
jgi:hypothetical protein